jgi:hypothetical protein
MSNKRIWDQYRANLSAELGSELANEFVDGLLVDCGGDLERAISLFAQFGRAWAPLIAGWATWVSERYTGLTAVILRDAQPITLTQQARLWEQVYLNRPLLGIRDELSGEEGSSQQPVVDYLATAGIVQEVEFGFVDTGCYGSVLLQLIRLGYQPRPLFFFSKNPAVPSFLGDLGVSAADGTLLNDSLECAFPHSSRRPVEFMRQGKGLQPRLVNADFLSIRFGEAAIRGLRHGLVAVVMRPADAVTELLNLAEQARTGSFTGLLPRHSPEWSGKQGFLDAWPPGLRWD